METDVDVGTIDRGTPPEGDSTVRVLVQTGTLGVREFLVPHRLFETFSLSVVGGASSASGVGRGVGYGPAQDAGRARMIALNVTRTVERETDFALPRPEDSKRDGDSDFTKEPELEEV